MKKTRILSTMLMVVMLTISLGCIVFGFAYKEKFMEGQVITPGRVHLAHKIFSQSLTKDCAAQVYYDEISAAGSYTVYMYKYDGTAYTLRDSDDQTVTAKSSSGYYSHVLSVYGGEEYMPAMRSYNTNITLQYLRVHYD